MAIEDFEYLSIFLYDSGYDMHVFVLGIIMPYHYIGLLPIAHILHVLFGDFKERTVIKMFVVRKVKADMGIAVLGGVALSLKVQHAPEELRRYALGNCVAVTEYSHTFFPEDVFQCPGTGFSINDLCYHPVCSSIAISMSALSNSFVFCILFCKLLFGLLRFLWWAILTSWLMLFPILLIW